LIYPADKEHLILAVTLLSEGKTIVYPTDTLYGIGVDATNTNAIYEINQLKGRSQPLSIVVSDYKSISLYAKIPKGSEEIINSLLPGPYTVILSKIESDISPLVTSDSSGIGIRIPDHPFPISLVKMLKKPIISTSINRHGDEPLNNVTQVEIDFPNANIFADNVLHNSKGSTIIDFIKSPGVIVRQGDGEFPI